MARPFKSLLPIPLLGLWGVNSPFALHCFSLNPFVCEPEESGKKQAAVDGISNNMSAKILEYLRGVQRRPTPVARHLCEI